MQALERAQRDANLAIGADQACTSGMGLIDQLDRLTSVGRTGKPSASSEQKASNYFSQHKQGRHLSHGLFLALQLLLESLDLPMVLGKEPLKRLLLIYSEHWAVMGHPEPPAAIGLAAQGRVLAHGSRR